MQIKDSREQPVDLDAVSHFYRRGIEKFGANAIQAVCWSSLELAIQCYHAITDSRFQNWQHRQAVLDFGSGQGHVLPLLRQLREFKGDYLGLELLPEFHDVAERLYSSDPRADFVCSDFLTHDFQDQQFDWVLSLGSFSVAQPDQEQSDRALLEKISGLARRGFSIYLNDVNKMDSVPAELAAHDLNHFSTLILELRPAATLEFAWFPTPESYQSVIHVSLEP